MLMISNRHKKWGKAVIPHKKPRWIPMARSKMFINPPTSLIPKVFVYTHLFVCLFCVVYKCAMCTINVCLSVWYGFSLDEIIGR